VRRRFLCAVITPYSPLRHWKVGNGQKVGIVGLGGLGHMGVKFAKTFGATVVLFATSPNKTADAIRLGELDLTRRCARISLLSFCRTLGWLHGSSARIDCR
jgi:D-arabinose 1-dehydrogenase-like Zn-dependent alcohol dehydrogenase